MAGETTFETLMSYLKSNDELKVSAGDLEILKGSVKTLNIDERDMILGQGEECLYLPVVISGRVKVIKNSESGREIAIYHIDEGGSCILSALGILNGTTYPASAFCEKKGEILLFPSRIVRDFVNRYEGWRNFIFRLYNSRFHQLFEFIDEILFSRLDVRMARYLLSEEDPEGNVRKTHQQIAEELGSTREVISRILKDMENRGFLELKRGSLGLTDREKLKKMYLM